MKAAKTVKIEKFEQGKHDHRFNLTLRRGSVKVRVCGYDMLPHLMGDGEDYTRITWEKFRCLLTNDKYVKEGPRAWTVTFAGCKGIETRSVLIRALTREEAVVRAEAYAKFKKWPDGFKLLDVETAD